MHTVILNMFFQLIKLAVLILLFTLIDMDLEKKMGTKLNILIILFDSLYAKSSFT